METLNDNKMEQINDTTPKVDILPRIDHLTPISEIHDLKLTGVQEGYYNNGQILYRRYYKDGKEEGQHFRWYDNGQLLSLTNWKDGKLEGLSESWDKDGQLDDRRYFKCSEIQWHESLDSTSGRIKRATFKKGFLQFVNQVDHFTDPTTYKSKKTIILKPKKKEGRIKI